MLFFWECGIDKESKHPCRGYAVLSGTSDPFIGANQSLVPYLNPHKKGILLFPCGC